MMVLEGNQRVDAATKSCPGGALFEASMNTSSRSQSVGTSRTRLRGSCKLLFQFTK